MYRGPPKPNRSSSSWSRPRKAESDRKHKILFTTFSWIRALSRKETRLSRLPPSSFLFSNPFLQLSILSGKRRRRQKRRRKRSLAATKSTTISAQLTFCQKIELQRRINDDDDDVVGSFCRFSKDDDNIDDDDNVVNDWMELGGKAGPGLASDQTLIIT